MASRYRIVCSVAKARGAKGEIVCAPVDGLPFLLRPGITVHVVPPTLHGARVTEVESVRDGGSGQAVRLAGVDSLGASEELCGRYLLVDEADLPEDLLVHDPAAIVGIEVADAARGPLGTVSAVMRGPANDVWEVRGPYGELLVPVVDGFIVSVSPDRVVMELPRGIVPEGGEGVPR
ncbi:16S rRNA processing protein RimM [Coriobacteriaceae bacterium]|uniref:Ribosome maturation factor RimM PRC barrel domain-containing protein n=1 Tax=Granulimonas faecalis TaxID=2894155 RepID=A0AAV5B4Y1_9ACTN|nr:MULTISPECIES: 16S rRNA processing protein RimM [Atopobiaceae]MBF0598596.1 16S rRNA processing protein RimM [Atopobiaceae bacterium FL090493]TGY60683.1 16S rRNA processing protein RimM [Coriobacteriaceae bacterium]GJM55395.1 hypothetical protein ATOP_10500 [Granulimonas faecalis]